MTDALTPAIPSFARLRSDIGRTYEIAHAGGERFSAELRDVREGRAMSRRHTCYAALLALASPMPQDIYTVCCGPDEWALLLTPIGPDEEDGRPLMEALFHVLRQDHPEPGVTDASSSRE